jgi:hypothetical protein
MSQKETISKPSEAQAKVALAAISCFASANRPSDKPLLDAARKVVSDYLNHRDEESAQDKRMAELRCELLQSEIDEFNSRTEENKKQSLDRIAIVNGRLQRLKQKLKTK